MIKPVLGEVKKLVMKNLKLFVLLGAVMLFGNVALEAVGNSMKAANLTGLKLMWSMLQWIIQMYAGLVMIKIMFRIADGETPRLDEVSKSLKVTKQELKQYVLVSLVTGIIMAVGLLLLIVPGVVLGLMYSMAVYAALDQDLGVKESLMFSRKITKGHRWNLFLFGLVVLLINIVAALPLGLGLLITIPATVLVWIVVYRRLSDPEGEKPARLSDSAPASPQIFKPASNDYNSYQI